MTEISIGPIKKLNLLGGTDQIIDWALFGQSIDLDVSVITSPRHAAEFLFSRKQSLVEELKGKGIKVHIFDKLNPSELRKIIGPPREAFSISISAAWIFQEDIISGVFENFLFNSHGSDLPQDRGGGGLSWQILMGKKTCHCLIHRMDLNVDTGKILVHQKFPYPERCRIPIDYFSFYWESMRSLMANMLPRMAEGPCKFTLTPQSEKFSSYWPRLHTLTHSWIDWSLPVDLLDRFCCAFDDPYWGAQTMHNENLMRLKNVFIEKNAPSFHPFQFGIVYRINNDRLFVAANGGTLVVQRVLDENSKSAIARIKEGDRFATPTKNLEQKLSRVFYTPQGLSTRVKPPMMPLMKSTTKTSLGGGIKTVLSTDNLCQYVAHQVNSFFPDPDKANPHDLKRYIKDTLSRVHFCFKHIEKKYFFDNGTVIFDHLHSDQYSMFLYLLSNTIFRAGNHEILANKIFLLNKTLHSVDAFFKVALPDIFLFVHPTGTVIGNAKYSNYFVIYQQCGIGSDEEGNCPEFGEGVVLYQRSAVMGKCKVGNNVVFGANSFTLNTNIKSNSVVVGGYPNQNILKNSISVIDRQFKG